MILPNKLEIGDTIGVVAPSDPIIDENIEELNRAKKIIETKGFKVKFSENIFQIQMDILHQQRKRQMILIKCFQTKKLR